MKITFKHCRNATAIMMVLSLSACTRFDTRMQANGDFDYQKITLTTPYQNGNFTNDGARNNYQLPLLTDQQKALGLAGRNVDIRPPAQLLAVIDGVSITATKKEGTKVLFNASHSNDKMPNKVWQLLESYLATNKISVVHKNSNTLETAIFSELTIFGGYFNKNSILKESSYKFTLELQPDKLRVALIVNALSYAETNEDKKLKMNLKGRTKQDVELRFINKLLEYAYDEKESEKLATANTLPLIIKLGFDNNHQSSWIAENDFVHTWHKLPTLFTLLNFKIVDHDKNLGYFLIKYNKPNAQYWIENDLKPFELDDNEYFIQLGEITEGTTSIAWLDEDKKFLSDQKVSEIYLSITNHFRDTFLENEKQTNEF